MQVGFAPNRTYFFASVNEQLLLPAFPASQDTGTFPLEVLCVPFLGQCEE